MSDSPIWTIIPFISEWEMTEAAVMDALQFGEGARVLVISNGAPAEDVAAARVFSAGDRDRRKGEKTVLLWDHNPPLPSLAATWNRAMRFAWSVGATEVLCANNDVRLAPWTFSVLKGVLVSEKALLVSAVGVTEPQYEEARGRTEEEAQLALAPTGHLDLGGPDFSCFLISREGHEKYPFQESLVPAFCEDLWCHRMMMLGGDGDRIFSVNVPYLHLASQSLKRATPERRAALEAQITAGSRAFYAESWGGGANEERFWAPGDPDAPPVPGLGDDPRTPALFDRIRARW